MKNHESVVDFTGISSKWNEPYSVAAKLNENKPV
jgi:hypothetical protein